MTMTAVRAAVVVVAGLATAVVGSPGSLICEDPRLVEGGKIMHLYVTSNEFSPEILLTADKTQYSYGKPVTVTVKAAGPTFAGFKFGVQVEATGNDGQALGSFSDLSTGLMLTENCLTSAYVESPMANSTYTFKWTPWNDGVLKTTGNATFKLVWGNGPGNAGFMQVDSPALYMKTVSLWDPTKWNPAAPAPPAPAPAPANGCHNSTQNSFKGSPVFIQHVDGGSQTFQADRCIKCRHDQACKSAEVVCPTRPGMPPIERLWYKSTVCQGSPDREAGLSEDFAVCPGPEHYSPLFLNLTRFVPKLLRDQGHFIDNVATAEAAIEEYRRMLVLVQKYPEAPVVPSKLVDLVWHEHVLDTQAYQRDCLRMFGRYLHHNPSFGGAEEKAEMVSQQQDMLKLYKMEFGEVPGQDIWPMARSSDPSGARLPDCCSALCAKPACAGCVGCNAVDCGHFEMDMPEDQKLKRVQLAPEQFAGYVATTKPTKIPDMSATFAGYPCTIAVTPQMTFGWTISNGYIYFKQQLLGDAWYGVGLNNVSGMPGADYMVSMAAGKGNTEFGRNNFTGVKDMYLYGDAAGYPCWDIEYECSSGNKTKGTHDLEDQSVNRVPGVTSSTWNRKLVTGDVKDYAITQGATTYAMFAWGDLQFEGDSFRYHKDNAITCTVDLFKGSSTCGV